MMTKYVLITYQDIYQEITVGGSCLIETEEWEKLTTKVENYFKYMLPKKEKEVRVANDNYTLTADTKTKRINLEQKIESKITSKVKSKIKSFLNLKFGSKNKIKPSKTLSTHSFNQNYLIHNVGKDKEIIYFDFETWLSKYNVIKITDNQFETLDCLFADPNFKNSCNCQFFLPNL